MTMIASPLARSALHDWHAGHGARFIDRQGWQVVAAYNHPQREVEAMRAGIGLVDLSAFAKLSLFGRGIRQAACELLGLIQPPSPHVVVPFNAAGRGLACQITAEHCLLLASTLESADFRDLAERFASRDGILPVDATSAYAGIGLLGPNGDELLRRVTSFDVGVRRLPPGACAATGLAGVPTFLIRPPQGVVPEVRVYIGWEFGEYVWETLWHAGQDWGVRAAGTEALAQLQSSSGP